MCLVHAETQEVASEAYAAFIGGGHVEVAVVTHARHRGKNLATLACASVLHWCHTKGFTPIWSCDVANAASATVARKLGFAE